MFSAQVFAQAANVEVTVQNVAAVSFDYALTDDAGNVVDSSKGKAPLTYTHGNRQIVPGLEAALTGMKVGEEKKVTVKPENGYGPVNPQGFQEVAKDKLPPNALKVGTILTAQGPQGQAMPVRVHEIKENTVIMDFNHPLAGKTLNFEIKITDIKPALK
ncbi:MAG: peptidylprolyl isomerase [Deltaproteobacteria bacterium]|nr:peptidylprolyl isomerase [Deltaproteobacteria bacterium]